jgi:hypothetical protein
MFIDYSHNLFTILFINHNLLTTVHYKYHFYRVNTASLDTNQDMCDNKLTLCRINTSVTTASLILHLGHNILLRNIVLLES